MISYNILLIINSFLLIHHLVATPVVRHTCSRYGRIRDLYNGRISSLFLYLKLWAINPSTLLAVLQLFSVCFCHLRYLVMMIPRPWCDGMKIPSWDAFHISRGQELLGLTTRVVGINTQNIDKGGSAKMMRRRSGRVLGAVLTSSSASSFWGSVLWWVSESLSAGCSALFRAVLSIQGVVDCLGRF